MGTTYRELFKFYDIIQSGDISSVESFLKANTVSINEVLPCKGIGVLHLAVGIDPPDRSTQCTELILKNGGDPNLPNDDGVTPVHIAAIWGRVDNIKLLIGCGGDPAIRDLDGLSAFDYAAREQQWEVYDYLRNVEDQHDDSFGSQCAYTLDLDKVLVTTDQLVAEYEPIEKNNLCDGTNPRKSDMIRDWCEKTNHVINKLYPTILGDTYLIENESVPWKTGDFTKNVTDDLSNRSVCYKSHLNETSDSFKTCLTKNVPQIEISGIKPLETTIDLTNCSCSQSGSDMHKNRMSIYENFSLPGSPNSIIHTNYNTKSSLNKCKKCLSTLCSAMKHVLTFDHSDHSSLISEEVDLDKALAVVQNKTNEFLSTNISSVSDVNHMNTRRSSASSGVSSHCSSGSIVLATMHEEYKYEDKTEDVVLIEKRLLKSPIVLPVDDEPNMSPNQSVISVASSLPPSVQYDNNSLRAELMKLGFNPGPIQDSTRTLYLKKLQALKKNPIIACNSGKTYSVELEKSLRSEEWTRDMSPYVHLESQVREDFSSSKKLWREGNTKTSFTYLLLDPRLTDNLPAKAGTQSNLSSWVTFVNSIFYVGKGKRSRPYSHLYQALTLWKRDFTTSKDEKVQRILDIWSDKVGVICLHIFQNVIPAEAYTHEAAMIDVIGIRNLKNLKSGNYYGVAASWPHKERRMLGLYLLYKAMQIFVSEGERQLRPDDID